MSEEKLLIFGHGDPKRLVDFIAAKLEISKNKAKAHLDHKEVFINQKRVWIASYQLKLGDKVQVQMPHINKIQKESFYPKQVLYQDEQYLIVNKFAGINANGPSSLETQLREYYQSKNIEAVHRLDKDTTGALVFAKNHEAFERIKEIFEEKAIKKIYLALAMGALSSRSQTINTPVDNQKAVSHIKVLDQNRNACLLEVEIETGRKHQVRVHLAKIGHALLGEKTYFAGHLPNELLRNVPRQMLHAWKISFKQPYTQAELEIQAPLPVDFKTLAGRLGLGLTLRS